MVARTQRSKRDLVISGIFTKTFCFTADRIAVFFPERTINKASLTESASSYASSQNLDGSSVVNYFGKGNNEILRIINLIEILDDTLFTVSGASSRASTLSIVPSSL